MKQVLVDVKKENNVEKAYPANENAEMFCYLINSKTLTRNQLRIIQWLGFEVKAEITWRA